MNQHLQFFRATFRRNCNYFFQKLSNSPKPEMHFVLQVTASNVKDGHNYSAIWCLKGAFSSSLSLTCKVGSCPRDDSRVICHPTGKGAPNYKISHKNADWLLFRNSFLSFKND